MRFSGLAVFLLCASPLTLVAQTDMQLPGGTPISITNLADVSSATAKRGDHFKLAVDSDIKVFGIPLIAKGAPVVGTVVSAKAASNHGAPGELTLTADSVQAVDGQYLSIANHTGAGATIIIFKGVAPDAGTFGMMRHGNEEVYKAKTHFTMVTLADVTIHVPDSAIKSATKTDTSHTTADSTKK